MYIGPFVRQVYFEFLTVFRLAVKNSLNFFKTLEGKFAKLLKTLGRFDARV
jgi:hypothetical protein